MPKDKPDDILDDPELSKRLSELQTYYEERYKPLVHPPPKPTVEANTDKNITVDEARRLFEERAAAQAAAGFEPGPEVTQPPRRDVQGSIYENRPQAVRDMEAAIEAGKPPTAEQLAAYYEYDAVRKAPFQPGQTPTPAIDSYERKAFDNRAADNAAAAVAQDFNERKAFDNRAADEAAAAVVQNGPEPDVSQTYGGNLLPAAPDPAWIADIKAGKKIDPQLNQALIEEYQAAQRAADPSNPTFTGPLQEDYAKKREFDNQAATVAAEQFKPGDAPSVEQNPQKAPSTPWLGDPSIPKEQKDAMWAEWEAKNGSAFAAGNPLAPTPLIDQYNGQQSPAQVAGAPSPSWLPQASSQQAGPQTAALAPAGQDSTPAQAAPGGQPLDPYAQGQQGQLPPPGQPGQYGQQPSQRPRLGVVDQVYPGVADALDKQSSDLANAYDVQMRAAAAQGDAEANMYAAEANKYKEAAKLEAERQALRERTLAKKDAEIAKRIDDHMQMKVNPNAWWSDMGNFGKAATVFSLALNGWFAPENGGVNLALEALNKVIDRDVDAQKTNISNDAQNIDMLRTNRAQTAEDFDQGTLSRQQEILDRWTSVAKMAAAAAKSAEGTKEVAGIKQLAIAAEQQVEDRRFKLAHDATAVAMANMDRAAKMASGQGSGRGGSLAKATPQPGKYGTWSQFKPDPVTGEPHPLNSPDGPRTINGDLITNPADLADLRAGDMSAYYGYGRENKNKGVIYVLANEEEIGQQRRPEDMGNGSVIAFDTQERKDKFDERYTKTKKIMRLEQDLQSLIDANDGKTGLSFYGVKLTAAEVQDKIYQVSADLVTELKGTEFANTGASSSDKELQIVYRLGGLDVLQSDFKNNIDQILGGKAGPRFHAVRQAFEKTLTRTLIDMVPANMQDKVPRFLHLPEYTPLPGAESEQTKVENAWQVMHDQGATSERVAEARRVLDQALGSGNFTVENGKPVEVASKYDIPKADRFATGYEGKGDIEKPGKVQSEIVASDKYKAFDAMVNLRDPSKTPGRVGPWDVPAPKVYSPEAVADKAYQLLRDPAAAFMTDAQYNSILEHALETANQARTAELVKLAAVRKKAREAIKAGKAPPTGWAIPPGKEAPAPAAKTALQKDMDAYHPNFRPGGG